MPRINQGIAAKPVESGGLLEAVNREILPILREMRRALNIIAGDFVDLTEDHDAALYERIMYCDATAGAFTVTLPAAADAKDYQFFIKKVDASVNAVTVASADDIDGAASFDALLQYECFLVHSDGDTYHILSSYT
jgi:hypothetical protein